MLRSRLLSLPLSLLVLILILSGNSGCNKEPQTQLKTTQAKHLPVKQFEWGMERLQRALDFSKPSLADGLYTDRKMAYELIEPTAGSDDRYTAKVTVTSTTEFIHEKRKTSDKDQKEIKNKDQAEKLKLGNVDPLEQVLELPGAGPQVSTVPPPKVEPRSIDNQIVFDLAYMDGKWKLQTEPDHEYQKMWFKYAFPIQ